MRKSQCPRQWILVGDRARKGYPEVKSTFLHHKGVEMYVLMYVPLYCSHSEMADMNVYFRLQFESSDQDRETESRENHPRPSTDVLRNQPMHTVARRGATR